MAEYYDRKGNEISMVRWSMLWRKNTYLIIKQEHVGDYWISTVWLGINHNFMRDGPPLIFETMVFKGKESDLASERYSTEEEALAGHERIKQEILLIESADLTKNCP
jgi:hypothetical protein